MAGLNPKFGASGASLGTELQRCRGALQVIITGVNSPQGKRVGEPPRSSHSPVDGGAEGRLDQYSGAIGDPWAVLIQWLSDAKEKKSCPTKNQDSLSITGRVPYSVHPTLSHLIAGGPRRGGGAAGGPGRGPAPRGGTGG